MTDRMTRKQAEKISDRLLFFDGESTPANLAKAKKRIIQVGEKLGMKFSDEDPRQSVNWTGTTANIGNMSVSNIIHEVAHYMVASPGNRNLVDYAQGAGVESSKYPADQPRWPEEQEELASLLGILWEKSFGLCTEDTLRDHCWIYGHGTGRYYEHRTTAAPTILQLNKFGLLDKHGRLRVRVRTT